MSSIPTLESRFLGSIFGLAVGDALGTTLEFSRPGTFTPITDLVGGGPFRLPPGLIVFLLRQLLPCCVKINCFAFFQIGNWTDDTSMAICMALSLVEKGEWNPSDCMERFVRWYNEGYMSGKDRCFDIGNTTADALANFTKTKYPYCGGTDKNCSGNGSIMRLCPVPLFFHKYPTAAIKIAADSSRLTHGSDIAKDCCRYMSGLIVGALQGKSKEELLSVKFSPELNEFSTNKLCPEVDAVATGSFKLLEPPNIDGSGYSVKALEAALWAFHRTNNFKDGLLKVVNLGNDSDTTGAIYGQIAGAYYGFESIPQDWVRKITFRSLLHMLSLELLNSSQLINPQNSPQRTQPIQNLHNSEPITSVTISSKIYKRLASPSAEFTYFMERFYWVEAQFRIHTGLEQFIRTKNEEDIENGYREMFKVGVIRDKKNGFLDRVDVVGNYGTVNETLEFSLWNDLVDSLMKFRYIL